MPLLALNQARRRGPGALRSHLPAHGGTRMHVDPGDRARLEPRLADSVFVGGTVKKPKEKKPA